MVQVLFEDLTGGSYVFKEPSSWRNLTWPAFPRKGDLVLDLNELKYEVLEVLWYDPWMVRVTVKRYNY